MREDDGDIVTEWSKECHEKAEKKKITGLSLVVKTMSKYLRYSVLFLFGLHRLLVQTDCWSMIKEREKEFKNHITSLPFT